MKTKISKILFIIGLLIVGVLISIFIVFKSNNPKEVLKGTWIADGTQYKPIIGVVDDKPVYAYDGADEPYYLIFDNNGNYTLKIKNHIETGKYQIDENKEVTLTTDEGYIVENCRLENKSELHCNNYASLFIKDSK